MHEGLIADKGVGVFVLIGDGMHAFPYACVSQTGVM